MGHAATPPRHAAPARLTKKSGQSEKTARSIILRRVERGGITTLRLHYAPVVIDDTTATKDIFYEVVTRLQVSFVGTFDR